MPPNGAEPGWPSGRPTAGSPAAADPRVARHLVDLRSRLRPICRDWDEAAFEALVLEIAWTKVRWGVGESRS